MTAGEIDDALWEAIADPTRRRILDTLVRADAATATTLATGMPVTRQAISKHLAVLEAAGLVTRERHGREVRYRVKQTRVAEASAALRAVAAEWDDRLLAIKRIAEDLHRRAAP